MDCPKCSVKNPAAARFCRNCGVEIKTVLLASPTDRPETSKSRRILFFIGSALLSALGLILSLAALTGGLYWTMVAGPALLWAAYKLFRKGQ